MKVLLGLGNPTKTYERTRHNIGKDFVDFLVRELNATPLKKGSKFSSYKYKNTVLATSETFMNLSAGAVDALFKTYPETNMRTLIVALDDLDHPTGYAGLKKTGSPEGHRGAISIMNKFSTKDLVRLKLGIDRPVDRSPDVVADYVLSKFSRNEEASLLKSFNKGRQLLLAQGFFV